MKPELVRAIAPVSNGAERAIAVTEPYSVEVEIQGSSPLLLHRWNVEGVAAKSAARKGSKAKKEDNIESYVYRDEAGHLCLPGEYFRQSIIGAAKFLQDPRSPRKSAMDLFKAALVMTPELSSLGVKTWDYLDQRRVQVQRNGITRVRPAMGTGWKARFKVEVLLPEYITMELLNEAVTMAGRLIGVGDFRPTYGRFQLLKFALVLT